MQNCLFIVFWLFQYLFLEGNNLKMLSEEFFPAMRKLKWLDIRNNKLTTLPTSIVNHPSMEVLLLQNNKIEKLPVEIGMTNVMCFLLTNFSLVNGKAGISHKL